LRACVAMKVLDGDDVRLSAKGRYAERDIVQVSHCCSFDLLGPIVSLGHKYVVVSAAKGVA